MEIIIHMDAKKIDTCFKEAIEEYIKRTSPFCKVSIKTYKKIIKPDMSKSSKKYILSPSSNTITSEELASLIKELNINGCSCIEFIVSNNAIHLEEYDTETFSVSSFSMSTDLTTVVLTEQLYRAYTILNNITYHK